MNHKIPEYVRLYQELRADIVNGRYAFGSRIPSKRTLAADQGVSVITAEHAIELLCEEGYAESRQRSGTFVIYREVDFPGKPSVIPMKGAGNYKKQNITAETLPDNRFPFSVLAGTMRRVLQEYGERILMKCPDQGCQELRQSLCDYLGRSRRITIYPEQVVIGSGAEYLYGWIAQLFGNTAVFALEQPSYHKIRMVYEAYGITCEMLPLGPEGIYSEALENSRAQILHVTPFHSYPSEVTASASKKHEYIRWAIARQGYLIEDNYDSELTVSRKAEEPLFSMAKGENVIYLNTFSETIAPSIRIGYMVLPKTLIRTFLDRLGFYACTVPLFEQLVLAELINSGDYERQINRIRRRKRKERQILLPQDK